MAASVLSGACKARMDFRTFLQAFILVPAQILVHGRQLIIRLLAWRPTLPTFFRLLDAL